MVCHVQNKNLLFIEPFLSSQSFVHKAKMKGYGTFVISGNDAYLGLPKKKFMAVSGFFQVDTQNEEAVLNLVKQIAQKFKIEGVIPEYEHYSPLSAKIAHYLQKPGLSPDAAVKIKKLEREGSIEERVSEQEYSIDGLIKNKIVNIVSVTEIFSLSEPEHREVAYIVRPEIDLIYFDKIADYLQNIIFEINVDYGCFHAKVKMSREGPRLLYFSMNFAKNFMPKLINYATGIDYCDNIFKLFSSQPLSLRRTLKLNVGIIFFYKEFMKQKNLMQHLKSLSPNSFLIEIREYAIEKERSEDGSSKRQKTGHAILIHQDYEILKYHIQEIEKYQVV